MTARTDRIGFIGLGTMGNPMVRRLLGAGHELVAYDVDPGALAKLPAARAVSTPAEVAAACRLVCTSLPRPSDVEAVVRGPGGILDGARSGDVHMDLSTNSYAMVQALHEIEASAGVRLVDAPVSGGAVGAESGELTVMISGSHDAVLVARPVLDSVAKTVLRMGERPGGGTLVKLINNAVFLCAGLLFQEGLALSEKAGLVTADLLEALRNSSASMYLGMADMTLSRTWENAFFTLALAEKDVALALESAEALEVPMPVTAAAHGVYQGAVDSGLGPEVFFATLKLIEERAGLHADGAAVEGAETSG